MAGAEDLFSDLVPQAPPQPAGGAENLFSDLVPKPGHFTPMRPSGEGALPRVVQAGVEGAKQGFGPESLYIGPNDERVPPEERLMPEMPTWQRVADIVNRDIKMGSEGISRITQAGFTGGGKAAGQLASEFGAKPETAAAIEEAVTHAPELGPAIMMPEMEMLGRGHVPGEAPPAAGAAASRVEPTLNIPGSAPRVPASATPLRPGGQPATAGPASPARQVLDKIAGPAQASAGKEALDAIATTGKAPQPGMWDVDAAQRLREQAEGNAMPAPAQTTSGWGDIDAKLNLEDRLARTQPRGAIEGYRGTQAKTQLAVPPQSASGMFDDLVPKEQPASPSLNPVNANAPGGQMPQRSPPSFVPMKTSQAVTSSGRSVPVEYGLVDINDLKTSHDDNFRPNPDYPPGLQPRDRGRAASEMQMNSMINPRTFRPELLGESADASNGAPIIGPDGLVESGNMRVMAMRRLYNRAAAGDATAAQMLDRYEDANGAKTDPTWNAGTERQMLVRVNRANMDPATREQFAREANQPAQLAMSATERAMADAKALPDHLLDQARPEDMTSAGNRSFVRQTLRQIASPNEMGTLIDQNGALSADGLRRVQGALLGKAYGDPAIIQGLIETTDTNTKAIGGALLDASPAWAKMRSMAARGQIPPELDITQPLNEAVGLIARARAEGRNVAEYVKQNDMFGGRAVSPEAESLLRWMLGGEDYSKRLGQPKIASALRFYADEAMKANAGPGLLGDTTKAEDLINAAGQRQQAAGTAGQPRLALGQQARPGDVRQGVGESRTEAQRPELGAARAQPPEGGAAAGMMPEEAELAGPKPGVSKEQFDRMIAQLHTERDEAVARIQPAIERGDRVYAEKNGLKYVVSREPSTGAYRLTSIDKDGPSGHFEVRNAKEAANEIYNLERQGFETKGPAAKVNEASGDALPYQPGVIRRDASGRPLQRQPMPPPEATERLLGEIQSRASPAPSGGSRAGGQGGGPTSGAGGGGGPGRGQPPLPGMGGGAGRGGGGRGMQPQLPGMPPRGPGGPPPRPPAQLNPQILQKNGVVARSWLGKIFSPSTVSKDAELQAGLQREEIGPSKRLTQQARAGLEHFRDTTELLGTPEGNNLMAYMEGRSAGAQLNNPGHQPVADMIRRLNMNRQQMFAQMPAYQQRQWITDYFSHMWKDPQRAQQLFSTNRGGAWQGSGRNLKPRSYPTYADGIAAGLEPLHPNIVDGEIAYLTNADRFIAHNQIVERMKANGTARYAIPGKQPQGWVPLNGRLGEKTTPNGIPLNLFAPEDTARVYNNMISRGVYGTDAGPLYDKVMRAKNGMTAMELSLSPFHLVTESTEAFFSQIARGMADIANGRPMRGAGKILTSPAAPVTDYMRGKTGAAEYLRPGSTNPQVGRLTDLLTKANVSPIGRGEAQYFTSGRGAYKSVKDFTNAMREATADIKGHPLAGPIRQMAQQTGRVLDTTMAPLFDKYIPRLKQGAMMGRLGDWLDHNPNASYADQLTKAREIADSMDNRFGEMNYDNLGWNAVMKQAAFMSLRAFGWGMGTWREIGGGVADLARGKVTERTAYIAALAAGTAAINGLATLANTGRIPQGMDFVAYDTGNKDQRGQPIRATIPGYAREMTGLGFNVMARGLPAFGSYAYGKLASMWQSAIEMVENRDWRDEPIGPPGAGISTAKGRSEMPEFLKSYFTEFFGRYVPMNMRGALGTEDVTNTKGLSPIEKALTVRDAPFAMQNPTAARQFFDRQQSRAVAPDEAYKRKLRREQHDAAQP